MKKFMIMGIVLASVSLQIAPGNANVLKCVIPYVESLLKNGKWDPSQDKFIANERTYVVHFNGEVVYSDIFKLPHLQNAKILSTFWDASNNSCVIQIQDGGGKPSELKLFPLPKTQQ